MPCVLRGSRCVPHHYSPTPYILRLKKTDSNSHSVYVVVSILLLFVGSSERAPPNRAVETVLVCLYRECAVCLVILCVLYDDTSFCCEVSVFAVPTYAYLVLVFDLMRA